MKNYEKLHELGGVQGVGAGLVSLGNSVTQQEHRSVLLAPRARYLLKKEHGSARHAHRIPSLHVMGDPDAKVALVALRQLENRAQ